MIKDGKQNRALYAIRYLAVAIRQMAYDKEDYSLIGQVADELEYLPYLVATPRDRTESFEHCLEALASKHRYCRAALDMYNVSELPEDWRELA